MDREPFDGEETCPRCAELAERIGVGQPAEKEGWGSMDRLTGGTAPPAEPYPGYALCETCGMPETCEDCQPAEEEGT